MQRLRAALCGCLLLAVGPLAARPYTIDDYLRSEAFGRFFLSPDGRGLIFERQIAFDQAARFGFNAMEPLRDRLYRVDLDHPGPATPLIPLSSGVSTIGYGFSPHGSRFAFARLDGNQWTLGVITVATGALRWFALAPDYDPFRPTLAWASDTELVAIVDPAGRPPWQLRKDMAAADALPHLWAAQAEGRVPTVTAIGSGRYLAITQRRPPRSLMVVNVVTGAVATLASGDLQILSLSPDGRAIALVADGEAIPARGDRPLDGGADLRQRHLSVIDRRTGRSWQPCGPCDLPFAPPIWSPTGDRVAFFARDAGQTWSQGHVWIADARRLHAHRLDGKGIAPVIGGLSVNYAHVALDWLRAAPIVFARRAGDRSGRADWYRLDDGQTVALTSPSSRTAPDLAHIASGLTMLAGPSAVRLTQGDARAPLVGANDWQAIPAATTGRRSGASEAVVSVTTGQGATTIATEDKRPPFTLPNTGMVTAIALGGKAQRLAAIVQRRDGSTDLIIVSRDGSPVTVATLNCDSADAEQAVPIALHYRLSDGTPVIGWLYLPPQSVRALLPLVTIPYGGLVYGDTPPSPDGRDLGDGFANVAAIVGHGYAVLLPSMPALVATDSEPLDFAAQVLPAVDAAIATGRIDSLRLGLWGHSFGAYNVAMILTQTARFAAAIVSNGPYDLASNAGTFTPWSRLDPGYGQSLFALPGWTETGQTGLGATPWANPKRYVANSVLYHADRITTPLLIVAADKDVASLQQSEILFSALYRQGKDAELLSYWGEDHVPVSPANIRDIHARAFAWFDDIFERASRSSR